MARAKSAGRPSLGGAEAFALHDTYGFPIDLTLEMAAEQGLQVDEAGFRRLMGEQRDRAKADARAKKSGHGDTQVYRQVADAVGGQVEFTGYDQTVTDATVRGIIRGDEVVERVGPARRSRSSSTAPRSMPSPAASWPTTASSASPTARSSR